MTAMKSLAIIALLAGGTSLAMAQNGLPTGGERPVAGGANGGWGGGWYARAPLYGEGYVATAPLYDYAAPAYGYAAPVYVAPPVYAVPAPLYGYYAAPYGYPPGSREWVIERGW
jgi:hypothetical protein